MNRYQPDKIGVHIVLLIFLTLSAHCKRTVEKTLINDQAGRSHETGITRLGIETLKSRTLGVNRQKMITVKLYERLLSIKGKSCIAYRDYDGNSLKVNHLLTGSVNRLRSGYSMSIRVSNRENGKIVYKRSSRVDEEIELDYILNDIAERVVEKLW